MEAILDQQQAGFRKGKSTVNQIFIVNQLVEKYLEFNRNIYHVFVDFEKAFDSVNHDILWKSLAHNGVAPKLLNLLKSLYANAECFVRLEKKLSNNFFPRRGVRQGCILSPLLFNLFLQYIINESNTKMTNKE